MCVRLCMRIYVIISRAAINPQHPPEPCGVAGSGAMYLSDKSEAERVHSPGPRRQRCQVLLAICPSSGREGLLRDGSRLRPKRGSDVCQVFWLMVAVMFEVVLQNLPAWEAVCPNCGI